MKQYVIKNNFSAGELAPTLYTRTDIQQYSNGAKELSNVIPLVEGGIKKRPGTDFINVIDGALRIIPFIVNSNDTFILIFKNLAIDVFNPRTREIITTLESPYGTEEIKAIQYVQYRYEMFITHSDVPLHRLLCSERFTNWQVIPFVYSYVPTDSENARYPFRKGKPSGKEIGQGVSFALGTVNGWDKAQSYVIGDVITYEKLYYQATQDSTDQQPDESPLFWVGIPEEQVAVFTEEDVGSYIDVNGGMIKITQVVDANNINGEVVKKIESDIQAIERAWSIIPPAFNREYGYPHCCTYFKQRLVLANTKKAPNKIWFSSVGGNGNFLETTDDGDAFSIVSASGLSNSILFLEAQRGVICLTSGGEFRVDSDGALSPSTVNINEHSAYGSYSVTRPERVGNELLFVQRGGQRLRALSYRYEVDGLVSPEISTLSAHIGKNHQGINELSYMQEPESIVWCILGDGKMATITLNRDQEVISWAQQDFGGKALSICSIPTGQGSDRSFLLIERNKKVCFEEVTFDSFLDCRHEIEMTSQEIKKSDYPEISCFDAYFSDKSGMYQLQFVETDTHIKFVQNVDQMKIFIGQPIQCKAVMFPPELSQNPASSLLYKAKIDRVGLFFHDTISPEFNGELIEQFDYSNSDVWNPRKPTSGIYLIEGGHWEDLHSVPMTVTHNKPLPFHMQAISIQISINER